MKKLLTPFLAILAIVLFMILCVYFCLEYMTVCFIRIIQGKKTGSLTDYLEKEFSHEEY